MKDANDAVGERGERACLLEGARQAFTDACQAVGPQKFREIGFRFAGHPVLLRVSGLDLAEVLYRCFEPLVAFDTPGPAALSISAWDRSQTGIGCPGIPHAPDITDVLGPGLMSQYANGRVLRYERADIVKCFDRASGELFLCVQDARCLRLNDRTKPFPHFLATWYFDRGVQLLHAGAVSRDGRGILLGGGGGSGKSTCVVACTFAGFDFLGDDTVGTAIENEKAIAHACYNAVRCDSRVLTWFPQLQSMSTVPTHPSDKNKSLVYISDVCPGNIVARASIAAVVATSVGGAGSSRLVPASKAATLRKLAPSTLLRGLGSGSRGFAHIAELIRRVPSYDLQIGETSADVPDLIGRLLSGHDP